MIAIENAKYYKELNFSDDDLNNARENARQFLVMLMFRYRGAIAFLYNHAKNEDAVYSLPDWNIHLLAIARVKVSKSWYDGSDKLFEELKNLSGTPEAKQYAMQICERHCLELGRRLEIIKSFLD